MSKAKHTAEPECNSSRDFEQVRIGSARWPEAMANARLIAAASELLDAALIAEYAIEEWRKEAGELRGVDKGLISAFKKLKSAIAKAIDTKAEGRT